MAVFTLEEAVIKKLREDSDIRDFLGTDVDKKVFIAAMRVQLFASNKLILPNIAISVDYGPEEPAIHAMNGICTIMMTFAETNLLTRLPTKFEDMSLLKEHIMDAVHKVNFSDVGFVVNHFNLLSGSAPVFNLDDKVWTWPLIFEFVHEDLITKDRVGVVVP